MSAEIIRLADDRSDFYVPDFQVFMFGTIPPTDSDPDSTRYPSGAVRDVVEVRYDDGLEQIDGFTLTVNNWDTQRGQPIYFGHYAATASAEHPDFFEPGQELLVSMGYRGNLNHMVLGMVTSVDVQFVETGHSKIVVSGLNVLDRLRARQYTWSWPDDGSTGIRDSDAALWLAREPDPEANRPGLGIPVRINEAARARETAHPNIFMRGQYPIVFLIQRARMLGYQVSIEEDYDESGEPVRSLYFGPPEDDDAATYILEWGKSLVSFHPTYASANTLWAVTACGWDRNAKQAIESRLTLEDLPASALFNRDLIGVARALNREEVIFDRQVQNEDAAKAAAEAKLTESSLATVSATATCVGLPRLRAGQTVHILGVGRHFDGAYNVVTTSHVINDQGYRTSFTAQRKNPDEQPSTAGGTP